jgi:hypothetical protein
VEGENEICSYINDYEWKNVVYGLKIYSDIYESPEGYIDVLEARDV